MGLLSWQYLETTAGTMMVSLLTGFPLVVPFTPKVKICPHLGVPQVLSVLCPCKDVRVLSVCAAHPGSHIPTHSHLARPTKLL